MTELSKRDRKIKELNGGSILLGVLPKGCKMCAKGSKMVLFVTGLCDSSCYYCPLSEKRAGKDVTYADEMPTNVDDDIIREADAIGAEGAGLSGGDPLCEMKRTLHFINLLKSEYGAGFHLHLYTSKTDVSIEDLQQLRAAGLDEIRFHPQGNDWSGIERAISLNMTVGIEVPAIPGKTEYLMELLQRAESVGVSFANVNELESSETNFERLVKMGMKLTSLDSASIAGSAETALNVLEWSSKNLQKMSVHYCSARYKDSVQLTNRLERRLKRMIRPFEIRDDDEPLLILGVIRAPRGRVMSERNLESLWNLLLTDFDVPEEMMSVDYGRLRLEIAPWILEEIAQELKRIFTQAGELEIGIAYEYPSWDRLQTLFEPL